MTRFIKLIEMVQHLALGIHVWFWENPNEFDDSVTVSLLCMLENTVVVICFQHMLQSI